MTTLALARPHTVTDDPRSRLHAAVAALHFSDTSIATTGHFDVRRGSGMLVRLVSFALRLPPPGRDIPFELRIDHDAGREHWRRSFNGRPLDAAFERTGTDGLYEVFGPLRLRYQMEANCGALVLRMTGAFIQAGALRVPVPKWASPAIRARAWSLDDGIVRARIIVVLPWVGLLLAYNGFVKEVPR